MAKSIRRNLTTGLSTVIVLVGLMAGSAFYFISAKNAERELNYYISKETNEFAEVLSTHLWNFDHDTVALVCSLLLDSRETVGVRVLGEKNRILFEKGQFAGANIINTERVIYYKDNIVGYLDVSYTKDLLWESKKSIIISSGLVVLSIVAVFIPVMIILLKRSLVKPLQQLKENVALLSERHYDEVSFSADQKLELQGIEDAFSKLSKDLEAREKELEEHRLHLEHLVAERTKELIESQRELISAERFAVLGKLSGGIAHEIRNPLSVIDSSAYYLSRKLKDADEKTKEHLGRISKQIRVSSDIIQSLQDLTKMKEPNRARLDVARIIEEGIMLSNIPRDVKLVKNIPKDNHFVYVDGKQLSMVFRNVLTNAVQAMNNKGTIYINAGEAENSGVNVTIEDTGPGIKQEDLGKIFHSFFGTKTSGFGFGLTICQMIMEQHGAKIEAQSEAGKGATFTLQLPSDENNKEANHEFKEENSHSGR